MRLNCISSSALASVLLVLMFLQPTFGSSDAGISCSSYPESFVEDLKKKYRISSAVELPTWILERLEMGCFGDLSVSYLLPDHLDDKVTFLVDLHSITVHNTNKGEPFDPEFLRDHDAFVAAKIDAIKNKAIFKEAYQEWSKLNVRFGYSDSSTIIMTGYGVSEKCDSTIRVEEFQGNDIINYELSNDLVMKDTMPKVALTRYFINAYLSNYYNTTDGANSLRQVTDSSCGKTNGYDSYGFSSSFYMGSHAAYADVECAGCPDKAQVCTKGGEMIPLIFTDLAANGTELRFTVVEGSYLRFDGAVNGTVSITSPATRNAGGKLTDSAKVGDFLVPFTNAHNGKQGTLDCVIVLEVRDGNGITVAIKIQEHQIPQGNILDTVLSWTPDNSGTYELRAFMISSLDEPRVLTSVASSKIEVS